MVCPRAVAGGGGNFLCCHQGNSSDSGACIETDGSVNRHSLEEARRVLDAADQEGQATRNPPLSFGFIVQAVALAVVLVAQSFLARVVAGARHTRHREGLSCGGALRVLSAGLRVPGP